MPIYNLIGYSSNYSKQQEKSSLFYSKYEITNFNTDIANDNSLKSFKHKSKLLGNTEADGANGILKNVTVVVSLKHLKTLANILYWYKYTYSPEMKSYAKSTNKAFFSKYLSFYWFLTNVITPVISSTQIACDVMCVQHVIH